MNPREKVLQGCKTIDRFPKKSIEEITKEMPKMHRVSLDQKDEIESKSPALDTNVLLTWSHLIAPWPVLFLYPSSIYMRVRLVTYNSAASRFFEIPESIHTNPFLIPSRICQIITFLGSQKGTIPVMSKAPVSGSTRGWQMGVVNRTRGGSWG